MADIVPHVAARPRPTPVTDGTPGLRAFGGLRWTSLGLRIATATVGVPLFLGIAWLGGPLYGLVVVLATVLAAFEARAMLRAAGQKPLTPVLVGLAFFLPFHAGFLVRRVDGNPTFGADGMVVLAVAVMASLLLPMLRREFDGVMADWGLSLAMALYLGGLMQFYLPLRDRPNGDYWVIATIGLSWLCDSVAFFAGRAWGRTPLAPVISPKKSVEGALCGIAAVTLWAPCWALITGQSPLLLAGFGAVIGAATVFGDLAESLLKRQTGVKDSGVLMPGHGGLLDRMDSLLFCGPVAVLYLMAFAS